MKSTPSVMRIVRANIFSWFKNPPPHAALVIEKNNHDSWKFFILYVYSSSFAWTEKKRFANIVYLYNCFQRNFVLFVTFEILGGNMNIKQFLFHFFFLNFQIQRVYTENENPICCTLNNVTEILNRCLAQSNFTE